MCGARSLGLLLQCLGVKSSCQPAGEWSQGPDCPRSSRLVFWWVRLRAQSSYGSRSAREWAMSTHLTSVWLEPAPTTNKLERIQSEACKTSVLVKISLQNGFWQHLCLHEKPQLQPASLEVLQYHQTGPDPGSFQISATSLGLRACEILYTLKWISGLMSLCLSFQVKPYWPLKPNILGAYLPKVGYTCLTHCEAWNPCFLGRISEL